MLSTYSNNFKLLLSEMHGNVARFRGNWNLLWVAQRYAPSCIQTLNIAKVSNALRAVMDMKLERVTTSAMPFVIKIEPTNLCNLHCPRCATGLGEDPRPKGFLDYEQYRSVLGQFKDCGMIVRLDGLGEPTLHPRLYDMIAEAKRMGFSVTISSNMNTPKSGSADDILASGLDRIIVAMDGGTQENYQRYRVGGKLQLVEDNLRALLEERRRRNKRFPIIDVQFLDWGYNHHEIDDVRKRVISWGADRLEVVVPDWAVLNSKADPDRPRRCFWLWCGLVIDWQMNYIPCTNAYTYPWPRINMNQMPLKDYWNSNSMKQARRFNIDKNENAIQEDEGCRCSVCSDMLVVDRPPEDVCR